MSEWIDINKQKPEHLQKVYTKNKSIPLSGIICEFRTNGNGYQFVFYGKNPITIYGVLEWKAIKT